VAGSSFTGGLGAGAFAAGALGAPAAGAAAAKKLKSMPPGAGAGAGAATYAADVPGLIVSQQGQISSSGLLSTRHVGHLGHLVGVRRADAPP
jgi:hypothetical protein